MFCKHFWGVLVYAYDTKQLNNKTWINNNFHFIIVTLGSIFHNSSYVAQQLAQVVNLSQPSITALMSVQIPSNKTDVSFSVTFLMNM